MRQVIFTHNDLEVFRSGHQYFVRYDAGAHQVVMREDEITEAEALFASTGLESAMTVLFALQKRLITQGIDPYVSNCPNA
jgi:hypothetical protein